MLFSVITVCFNSATTIRATFDSLLAQSCKDYEYLVIDGASTDRTVDIIKEYEPRFEGRMCWISEPDKGIYDAMNKGIGMSTGEYIVFMNSDDTLENDCLKYVRDWIIAHPNGDIYYGIASYMNSNGEELYLMRVNHRCLSQGKMICHQSIFTSREVFEDLGNFRTEYKIIADHEFCLRAQKSGKRYSPMPFVVCHFRWGGFSTKDKMIEAHKKELDKLLIEYGYLNPSIVKHNNLIKRIEMLIETIVLSAYKCVKFILFPFIRFSHKSDK